MTRIFLFVKYYIQSAKTVIIHVCVYIYYVYKNYYSYNMEVSFSYSVAIKYLQFCPCNEKNMVNELAKLLYIEHTFTSISAIPAPMPLPLQLLLLLSLLALLCYITIITSYNCIVKYRLPPSASSSQTLYLTVIGGKDLVTYNTTDLLGFQICFN